MQGLQKIRTILSLLIFATHFVFPLSSYGNESNKSFLIAPFENLSSQRDMTLYEVPSAKKDDELRLRLTVDRYSELPRSLLEDEVVNRGGSVVERQQVDHLLREESEHLRLSGLVNPAQIIEIGGNSGATHVVLGTINSIKTIHSKIKIRGSVIEMTRVECALRVRVIEIETGEIKFSKRVKGSVKSHKSESGEKIDDDSAYSAIEVAIQNLFESNKFEDLISK